MAIATTPEKFEKFVEALKRTGHIGKASIAVDISPSTGWRLVKKNPELEQYILDGRKISPKKQNLFDKKLKEHKGHIVTAAHEAGISFVTGYSRQNRKAEAKKGNVPLILLRRITGMKTVEKIAEAIKLPVNRLHHIISEPEIYKAGYCLELIEQLDRLYPKKQDLIDELVEQLCFQRVSAGKIRPGNSRPANEYRRAAGSLLRDCRVKTGVTLADVAREITSRPALCKNIERVENGDRALPLTIVFNAVAILPPLYAKENPKIARRTELLLSLLAKPTI